jgi:hypothetical protein
VAFRELVKPEYSVICNIIHENNKSREHFGSFLLVFLMQAVRPKRDEIAGEWRKLHNEELHNLNSSPSIIRMIKSRRMRWAGRVARMGEKRKGVIETSGSIKGWETIEWPNSRWPLIVLSSIELVS